jgi:hypothetical protein
MHIHENLYTIPSVLNLLFIVYANAMNKAGGSSDFKSHYSQQRIYHL